MADYFKDESGRLWWCNSHGRKADFICVRYPGDKHHCCDPQLGGILLPCYCVDLTDEIEITPS